MKIITRIANTLEEELPKYILTSITICLGFLLSKVASQIDFATLGKAFSDISNNTLLAALATCLLLILILFSYVIHLKNSKLRYKFGLFWDNDKIPHCPTCRIAMHFEQSIMYSGRLDLSCGKCNYTTQIWDEFVDSEGTHVNIVLTLKEAQDEL